MAEDTGQPIQYIYDKVADWLKFAETKNAAMITLSGATAFAIIQLLTTNTHIGKLHVPLEIIVVGMFLSLLVSLFSFLPKTAPRRMVSHRSGINVSNGNLVFYGDIQRYAINDYKAQLARMLDVTELGAFEDYMAAQIVINAKICMKKFQMFNWSLELLVGFTFAAAILWFIELLSK